MTKGQCSKCCTIPSTLAVHQSFYISICIFQLIGQKTWGHLPICFPPYPQSTLVIAPQPWHHQLNGKLGSAGSWQDLCNKGTKLAKTCRILQDLSINQGKILARFSTYAHAISWGLSRGLYVQAKILEEGRGLLIQKSQDGTICLFAVQKKYVSTPGPGYIKQSYDKKIYKYCLQWTFFGTIHVSLS